MDLTGLNVDLSQVPSGVWTFIGILISVGGSIYIARRGSKDERRTSEEKQQADFLRSALDDNASLRLDVRERMPELAADLLQVQKDLVACMQKGSEIERKFKESERRADDLQVRADKLQARLDVLERKVNGT